jgi:hypothetical protein
MKALNLEICLRDVKSNGSQKQHFIDRVLKPSYWKKEGVKKMKFDAIVGNPPYQESISSDTNASLGKQLFPYFIINSIGLRPKYVSLITPSRWFTGDAQDKSFIKLRDFIKENNHMLKLFNYKDEKELFSNVEIKGGINYFLFKDGYNGQVEFVNCIESERKSTIRNLFEDGMDIIISNSDDFPILNKVRSVNFVPLTQITTGRNAFGIIGKQSNVDKVSSAQPFDGCCELRCKGNEIRYIKRDIVKKKY